MIRIISRDYCKYDGNDEKDVNDDEEEEEQDEEEKEEEDNDNIKKMIVEEIEIG